MIRRLLFFLLFFAPRVASAQGMVADPAPGVRVPDSQPIATDVPQRPPVVETPPQPIGSPSRSQPSSPGKRAAVAAFTVGLDAEAVRVGVDDTKIGVGGAVGARVLVIGSMAGISVRALGAAALGGQTTGFSSRFSADASFGVGLPVTSASLVFLRAGMDATSYKDDDLDVSVYTLPLLSTGLQLASESILFEIGPRAGSALRAVYAPGNEAGGHRHYRASSVQPSWGAGTILAASAGYVEGGFARVEQTNGMWLGQGSGCVFAPISMGATEKVTLCGWVQHWEGPVLGPSGSGYAASSAAGVGIGFGMSRVQSP